MELLTIEKTKSSPCVRFDPATRVLDMRGESYPANATKFYEPIMNWLAELLGRDSDQEVVLNMEILYFNSSSSKVFMNMFDMLDEAAEEGRRITINWRYHEENEIAQECGEEFMEDLVNLDFHLVEFGDD